MHAAKTRIWTIEQYKLELLNDFTVIHDKTLKESLMHQIMRKDYPDAPPPVMRTIHTMHETSRDTFHNTIKWYLQSGDPCCTPCINAYIPTQRGNIFSITNVGESIVPDGQDNMDSYQHIPLPDNYTPEMDANDIIQHAISVIASWQTPKHLEQFLIGCKALQQIIAPEGPIPYIGHREIGKAYHNTKNPPTHVKLWTTPFPPIPHINPNNFNDDITFIYDPLSFGIEQEPHETYPDQITHTHNIDLQGRDALYTAFGPWRHPIKIREHTGYDGNNTEYNDSSQQHLPWPDRFAFLPPTWANVDEVWDKSLYSQHEWIGLQRRVQHTATSIQPYITPVSTCTINK